MTRLQEIKAGLELLGGYDDTPDIQAYQNRLIIVVNARFIMDQKDVSILEELNWEIDGRNYTYRGL